MTGLILAWLNETGTHLDKSKAKMHQGYTPAPAPPAVGGTSHRRLPPEAAVQHAAEVPRGGLPSRTPPLVSAEAHRENPSGPASREGIHTKLVERLGGSRGPVSLSPEEGDPPVLLLPASRGMPVCAPLTLTSRRRHV